MADSESAALTGLGDTPAPGAVGETRTLMALTTATSRLRVYQFRHDRIFRFFRSAHRFAERHFNENGEKCKTFRFLSGLSLLLKATGRGSRIRTYEWRIQNPLP